jgi:hypothetical protein
LGHLDVAAVSALAMPAMADEVGVRAGPVGAGVTVGEGHRDYDRDRDRDRTTAPSSRSMSPVIEKQSSRRSVRTALKARPPFTGTTTKSNKD